MRLRLLHPTITITSGIRLGLRGRIPSEEAGEVLPAACRPIPRATDPATRAAIPPTTIAVTRIHRRPITRIIPTTSTTIIIIIEDLLLLNVVVDLPWVAAAVVVPLAILR
jgi:hypothetical protein